MSSRMKAVEIKKGNKDYVIRFVLKNENYDDDEGYTSTITIWYFDDDEAVHKIVDGASCSAGYFPDAYGGNGATYVDFLVTEASTSTAGTYFAEVNFTKNDLVRDTKTFMWKVKQGSR